MKKAAKFLPFLISAAFLYLCLKDFSFSSLHLLKNVDPAFWTASILMMVVTFIVQALRLHSMLGLSRAVKKVDVFSSVMIGHFSNAVLPSRAGEFLRCHRLAQVSENKYLKTLAVCSLERFTDFLCAVILFIASFLYFAFGKDHEMIQFLYRLGITIAIFSVPVFIFMLAKKKLVGLIDNRFKHPLTMKLKEVLEHVYEGYSVLNSKKKISMFFLYTLFFWAACLVSNFLLLKSMDFPGEVLTASGAVFFTAIITLAYAIPSTPSGIGVINYAIILFFEKIYSFYNLNISAADKNLFITASFVFFTALVLPDIVIGSYFFFRDRKHLLTIKQADEN